MAGTRCLLNAGFIPIRIRRKKKKSAPVWSTEQNEGLGRFLMSGHQCAEFQQLTSNSSNQECVETHLVLILAERGGEVEDFCLR